MQDGFGRASGLESRYRSVGQGVKLDPEQANKLRALVLRESSYLRGRYPKGADFASKLCLFDPIVRIRFEDARDTADAWVCFACADVVFTSGRTSSQQEDFSPMSRELLVLVKSILKEDPVIAKIRER